MDGFDKDICPICGEPAPNGTPAGAAHLETHSREELIASTLNLRDRLEAAVEQVMQLGRRP